MSNTLQSIERAIRDISHVWVRAVARRLKIVITDEIPTAATDGVSMFFNASYWHSISDDEKIGVAVHEALHVIMRHPVRRNGRDPKYWNIACDHAINWHVEAMGYELPEGALDGKSNNAERLYKTFEPAGKARQEFGGGQHVTDDGPPSGDGSQSVDSNPGDETAADGNDLFDYPLKPGQTMADAEREIEKTLARAQQDAKMAGTGSEVTEREIELFKPVDTNLHWPSELEDYIQFYGGAEYSMNPPHAGFMQQGIICNQLNPTGVGDVVLAVDVSGSIDTIKLRLAITHLLLFAENIDYESLRIITCDDSIRYDRRYERGEPVDMEHLMKYGVTGGGTEFVPVFNRLSDEGTTPNLLIYFTDMLLHPCETPEDPGYPVIWLVDQEVAIEKNGDWAKTDRMSRLPYSDPRRDWRKWGWAPDWGHKIDATQ